MQWQSWMGNFEKLHHSGTNTEVTTLHNSQAANNKYPHWQNNNNNLIF